MTLIRINKQDYNRILLTDTLPYEVPLIFSNEGFYHYVKANHDNAVINSLLISPPQKKDLIPFQYKIKKDNVSHRTLSVPHPRSQLSVVDLYKEYDSLILSLCSRSSFSIRSPARVASHYYEKEHAKKDSIRNGAVETELEAFQDQPKHASSYFTYNKYNIIHKFYDSYEFHRLEKRFLYYRKLDISKCFHSIYTHTVAWAIKDKQFAKLNRGCYSFEKRFDELMQRANHGETNGILVGPEFSRIFAEIILQSIDTTVEKTLSNQSLSFNNDYSIRRYVDDYFIFYNETSICDTVTRNLLTNLELFKLYINENKLQDISRPFITAITCAKIETKDFISRTFKGHFGLAFEEIDDIDPVTNKIQSKIKFKSIIHSEDKAANRLISEYKSLIKRNNISLDTISGYTIGALQKNINSSISRLEKVTLQVSEEANISSCISVWVEFLFFVYSMDTRVSNTYSIAQTIIRIVSFTDRLQSTTAEHIKKKIFDESISILKTTSRIGNDDNIELLNLILALSTLGNGYSIPIPALESIFKIDSFTFDRLQNVNLNYFQITTMLYYTMKHSELEYIAKEIEMYATNRILNCRNPADYCELTCLSFDLLSCRIISKASKNKIARHILKTTNNSSSDSDVDDFVEKVSNNYWFISWDSAIDFEFILRKRKLRSPY